MYTKEQELTLKRARIMEAFSDGKTIEWRDIIGTDWYICCHPSWDWSDKEYRIKPEPKYRTYKNAKEYVKASKEHGPYLFHCGSDNKGDTYYMPTNVDNEEVTLVFKNGGSTAGVRISYIDLFNNYVWQDGSKCGEIVKDE